MIQYKKYLDKIIFLLVFIFILFIYYYITNNKNDKNNLNRNPIDSSIIQKQIDKYTHTIDSLKLKNDSLSNLLYSNKNNIIILKQKKDSIKIPQIKTDSELINAINFLKNIK